MGYWLLKSEPDCYSIHDLRTDTGAGWDGVRNYQARNFLRAMKKGDRCVFYHSGAPLPSAAGTCHVAGEAYPDHTQFDPAADHYDAQSDPADPRWSMVDIAFESVFAHPVPIAAMRANPRLSGMKLLEKGSRLSVLPLTKQEYEEVVRMGK